MGRPRKNAVKKQDALLDPQEAPDIPMEEQPYPLPKGWIWVELSEAATIKRGASPRPIKSFVTTDVNGINWIKIGDTDSGKYITSTSEKITKDGLKNSVFVQEGTLLLSNSMSFGRPYILKIAGCIHDGWLAITPKENINQDFLYYALMVSDWYFEKVAVGTAVRNLNSERVSHTPIPLPPLDEQQRLVDSMESLFAKLDEAKEQAEAVLDNFETRKAAILHKAFTGELIGKENIILTPLESILDSIRIGPFGSALHEKDYIRDGIPIINPKHIVKQNIIPSHETTISPKMAQDLSNYKLKENDIIFGRRGEMGRCAPVSSNEDGWICGTGSMILRLRKKYCARLYSLLLSSPMSIHYLESNAVGTTLKNLNEKIIKKLPVPKFSFSEQIRIITILNTLLTNEQQVMETAESVLEQIELMKKSILARAFRGELSQD